MSSASNRPRNSTTNQSKVNQIDLISLKQSNSSSPPGPDCHSNFESDQTVRVKNERSNNGIKEYAVNELLAWYGYEKFDKKYTIGLNLDRCSTSKNDNQQSFAKLSASSSSTSPLSTKFIKDNINAIQISSPLSLKTTTTTTTSPKILENSPNDCTWCGKTVGLWERENGSRTCFNSEACFVAERRAAFKRAKTCDWCKHIRHSVTYVDFQNGESQLQFCSDKCLNQYKMNIFCKETQAHLKLHGISNIPMDNLANEGSLITPELWLKDCQSPVTNRIEEKELKIDETEDETEDEEEEEEEDLIVDDDDDEEPAINYNDDNNNDKETMKKHYYLHCELLNLRKKFKNINNFNKENIESAIEETLKDQEYRKYLEYKKNINLNPIRLASDIITPKIIPGNSLESFDSNYSQEGSLYLKDMRKLIHPDKEPNEKINHSYNIGDIPPVTVLIPYLIPVPIPILIPVKNNNLLIDEILNSPEDLSKRTCNNNVNTTGVFSDYSSDSSTPPVNSSSKTELINPSNNSMKNKLRKKRHSTVDDVEIKYKKRSKV